MSSNSIRGTDEVATNPDVLQRKHYTLDTCAQACLAEKEIKCKNFKFMNTSGTCYLSAKDYPDFSDYKDGSKTSLSTTTHKPTLTTPKGLNVNTTGVDMLQKNKQNPKGLNVNKTGVDMLQKNKQNPKGFNVNKTGVDMLQKNKQNPKGSNVNKTGVDMLQKNKQNPKGSNVNKTGVDMLQKNKQNQTNLVKLMDVSARLQKLKEVEDRLFKESFEATNDLSKTVGKERSTLGTHNQLLQILMQRTLKINHDFKALQLYQSNLKQQVKKATINDNNLWQRVTSLAKADAMAVEQQKKYAKLLWKFVQRQQNLRKNVKNVNHMLEKQNVRLNGIKSLFAATLAATALRWKEIDQRVNQIQKSLASVSKDSTHFDGNVRKNIKTLKASMNELKKVIIMIATPVARWKVLQVPSIREHKKGTVQRKITDHHIGLLRRYMAKVQRKTKKHARTQRLMRMLARKVLSLKKNNKIINNKLQQMREHEALRILSVKLLKIKKENKKLKALLRKQEKKNQVGSIKQAVPERVVIGGVSRKGRPSKGAPHRRFSKAGSRKVKLARVTLKRPVSRTARRKGGLTKGAPNRRFSNAGSRKARPAKGAAKRRFSTAGSRQAKLVKDSRLQSSKTNVKKRVKKDVTSCPPLFTASTVGKYCFLTSTMQLTFDDAKMYCNKYKGKLTTIDTKEKETAIQTFLSRNRLENKVVWLSRVIIDDNMLVWKESHKPLSNYNNFKEGQAPYGASCILLDTSTRQWISRPCPENNHEKRVLHSVICEPYVPLLNDYKTIGADKRKQKRQIFQKLHVLV